LPGLLLDQVPPAGVLLSVIVAATQTVSGPVIAVGSALTVRTVEFAHPVAVSVKLMVDVPDEIPPATPVAPPMVPTAGVLLDHVPTDGVATNVVVKPTQTEAVPEITGCGLTVTVIVLKHVPTE
jgi:hypothetical protein